MEIFFCLIGEYFCFLNTEFCKSFKSYFSIQMNGKALKPRTSGRTWHSMGDPKFRADGLSIRLSLGSDRMASEECRRLIVAIPVTIWHRIKSIFRYTLFFAIFITKYEFAIYYWYMISIRYLSSKSVIIYNTNCIWWNIITPSATITVNY